MIRRYSILLAVMAATALTGSPRFASAKDATPEGATSLTQVLETYFGKAAPGQPPSVKIVPNGPSYDVSFDSVVWLKALSGLGLTVESKPWQLRLDDQGDGTWHIVSGAFPETNLKGPNGLVQQMRATNWKMDAIFDTALAFLRRASYSADLVTSNLTSPGGNQASSYGPMTAALTASPNANGSINIVMNASLGNYVVDMTLPDPTIGRAGPLVHVGIKANQPVLDLKVDGFQSRDWLPMQAFLVAHPDTAAMAAGQADLKAALRKIVPLFQNLVETVSTKDLSFDTAAGNFSGRDIAFGLDTSGAVPNGHFKLSLKGSSLSLPKGRIPGWVSGFMPTLIDLAPEVTGLDLNAAAKELIEDFTLNSATFLSDGDYLKIAQAIMPAGSVKISFGQAHIASALLDVKIDGDMEAGPAKTAGKVNISATGLDAALDALKTAVSYDRNAAQAFGALTIAKGLGKPGNNGALIWAVELTPDRRFVVNGTPFGGK